MSEKKNGRKRCWIIVIFDVTGLLPTDQTIGYITMALPEFVRKRLMLTVK